MLLVGSNRIMRAEIMNDEFKESQRFAKDVCVVYAPPDCALEQDGLAEVNSSSIQRSLSISLQSKPTCTEY